MENKPSKLRALFNKHREVIVYLFFGGVTTAVSWLVYSLYMILFPDSMAVYTLTITSMKTGILIKVLETEFDTLIMLATIISWVAGVAVAYVTNKIWVFNSRSWKPSLVARELKAFVGGRVLTGIFQTVTVPLLAGIGLNQDVLGVPGLSATIIVSVVVVILNYFISKFFAFKADKAED